MSIVLRPETQEDVEFLRCLYATTRESEMALVPWSDAQKEAFLTMQFKAQREYYLLHYPTASFQVIEVDGAPAGRLYVNRWEHEIRVMDIALMPAFRGRGIGGRLLSEVLEEGQNAGKPVTCHVEAFNPARFLYHRLGFIVAEDKGVYLLMRWTPSQNVMK